ncbi:1-acyl-glycerol-3-phosphate acyltransferase PlsC [Psychromonas ingrahamii 37]|uniref:1-acyl-glycerol-3-phosphate acyltransferase PlsC n=1 Tax=Psychromonas ingrahamii (strain DSM 17664 / CCUG 51855 / 37) TaxID=357804 RepID=A1SZ56_PSYIN|nr:lysophospholipid acyltransferase family protein [Psychromonas ingrahamii]ABM04771.1 1-acyl-glycerol-3-phosphate acyltransferase PlsC [Psychromonas ingrahamii 37]
MNLKQIQIAIYSLFLTNKFGFKLNKATTNADKKKLRLEYAVSLFSKLNIEIVVSGLDKVNPDGQYLLLSNHRSIIDPCVIEMALKDTNVFGLWVAKKELYNSFFFGKFVRNGGSILLDRGSNKMSQFFKDIKKSLSNNASIFIFPEGTRNVQDTDLTEFKKGTQLIAVKNKLQILPVYIRTNSNTALKTAIKNREKKLQIEVEFGDVIDYKDRTMDLEQAYRNMFDTQA